MSLRPGQFVEVVKGRKVPIGTIGILFWVGQTKYGWAVGLRWATGKGFTAYRNVVAVKPSVEEEDAIRAAVYTARKEAQRKAEKRRAGQLDFEFGQGERVARRYPRRGTL